MKETLRHSAAPLGVFFISSVLFEFATPAYRDVFPILLKDHFVLPADPRLALANYLAALTASFLALFAALISVNRCGHILQTFAKDEGWKIILLSVLGALGWLFYLIIGYENGVTNFIGLIFAIPLAAVANGGIEVARLAYPVFLAAMAAIIFAAVFGVLTISCIAARFDPSAGPDPAKAEEAKQELRKMLYYGAFLLIAAAQLVLYWAHGAHGVIAGVRFNATLSHLAYSIALFWGLVYSAALLTVFAVNQIRIGKGSPVERPDGPGAGRTAQLISRFEIFGLGVPEAMAVLGPILSVIASVVVDAAA